MAVGSDYRILMYRALQAPLGLVVACENARSERARFYKERKLACDPALDNLSIAMLEDDPNHLYILRLFPCPDEQPNQPDGATSGSSHPTGNGSSTTTTEPSASPKQSE